MENGQYLGGVLYHFWPHEPRSRALSIFRSICERGLLLKEDNAR